MTVPPFYGETSRRAEEVSGGPRESLFERGEEKMNEAMFWMGERGSEGDAICANDGQC